MSHYVDITSIPRTHVLKEIAEYASDEEDKRKMKMMGTSTEEGKVIKLEVVHKIEMEFCVALTLIINNKDIQSPC